MKKYIHNLTNRVFKLLTIREKELCGVNAYFAEYADSLLIEVSGAMHTFPELQENDSFIVVHNILGYLCKDDVSYPVLRREVFKALHLLNKIEASCEVEHDG